MLQAGHLQRRLAAAPPDDAAAAVLTDVTTLEGGLAEGPGVLAGRL